MPTHLSSRTWVTFPEPNPRASFRLFCLPYAGASARTFSSWAMKLPLTVELCPIELPGHGSRLMEKAFNRLHPLVDAIAAAILPFLDKPFACFGHSMGALLSFELAVLLQKHYGKSLTHLFISGRRAPEIPSQHAPIHDLPDTAFVEGLVYYNGMPKAVLQNTKFMQLILPTLKADFALVETYEYVPQSPLECPITTFGGMQDPTVSYDALRAWQKHTHAVFTTQMFPGNHFFIHSSQQLLLQSLSQILQPEGVTQNGE